MNMKPLPLPDRTPQRQWRREGPRAAFTLVELMVAVSLFAVASGIFFAVFSLSLTLGLKNVSLNDSGTSLQNSYARCLTTLEGAVSLVDCANFDPTTQTFTAVADGTWGNAVRYTATLPLVGYILPDDGSGYNVNNPPAALRTGWLQTGAATVSLSFNPALYPSTGLTIPSSARLLPAFPATSETVSGGASPGVKPGLGIAAVTFPAAGRATVSLDNALGVKAVTDCTRAYVILEGALAVVPEIPGAAGGPRRLLRFDDATPPGQFPVVCRSLDGARQVPPDGSVPGGTLGCFRHPAGSGAIQAMLPILSRDYSSVVRGAGRGGAVAGTNVWIRLTPQFRFRQTL